MFASSRCPLSIGSGAPLVFQRGAADRGECREAVAEAVIRALAATA